MKNKIIENYLKYSNYHEVLVDELMDTMNLYKVKDFLKELEIKENAIVNMEIEMSLNDSLDMDIYLKQLYNTLCEKEKKEIKDEILNNELRRMTEYLIKFETDE